MAQALEAIERRDWAALKPLLHPYVHWSEAGRPPLRGRGKVLDRLEAGSPPAPPAAVELRDGQVYRWAGGGAA